MSGVWMDLKVAGRSLTRRPGFAAVAVVTLGVAVGANAALFSLLDQVVLSPLAYPDSDELVEILHRAPGLGSGTPRFEISDGYYLHYRESTESFQEMGAWAEATMTLTGDFEPERVTVAEASPSLFSVLGLPPARGRYFTPDEGRPQGGDVALLSHDFWQDRFGGDPGILGRTLTLNGESWQIVGVASPDMSAPFEDVRVWVPMQRSFATASATSFRYRGLGRLRPGVSRDQADADLTRALYSSGERFPGELQPENFDRLQMSTFTEPLKESVVGDLDRTLWLLVGAVALVLVIAWANVANLVLVRTEGRRRELAVRSALGAGRGRMLRHFVSEGAALSGLAGLVGVGLAVAAMRALVALAPGDLPRMGQVGFDGTGVLVAGLLTLASTILVGAVPVLRGGDAPGASGLKDGGRSATAGAGPQRARSLLVVGQVALSVVLLVGSGLMVRSFAKLMAVDPGIEVEDRLAMRLTIDRSRYPTLEEAQRFWSALEERIAAVPGVESAGLVGELPTSQNGGFWAFRVEDQPLEPGELPDPQMLKTATVGYLRTVGVPLLEGRSFDASDRATPFDVTVVNRALAREYWPDESPLGKRVRISGPGSEPQWRTIVGVVDDVRERGLDQEAPGSFYGLLQPEVWGWQSWSMHLVVHTSGAPLGAVPTLRDAVWSMDPNIPITRITTLEEHLAQGTARTVFTMMLLAVAAGVSLLLGTVGLYGVVSYVVTQRTQEIGVRLALGAEAGRVRSMVIRQGMLLAGAGVLVGGAVSLGVGRLLSSFLFEVSPRDPVTLASVSAALLLVTAAACWIPARRAARVDPVVALRAE